MSGWFVAGGPSRRVVHCIAPAAAMFACSVYDAALLDGARAPAGQGGASGMASAVSGGGRAGSSSPEGGSSSSQGGAEAGGTGAADGGGMGSSPLGTSGATSSPGGAGGVPANGGGSGAPTASGGREGTSAGDGGAAGETNGGSAGAPLGADSCEDGSQNGAETAPDCGGGECDPCPFGSACATSSDCVTRHCIEQVCTTIDCTNRALDGTETDVDCGGTNCPVCSARELCRANTDCASGVCASGLCQTQRTCAEILRLAAGSTNRVYSVDPDGPNGAEAEFGVYCDMTTAAGGWTRVGFERRGAGGHGVLGGLPLLGATVGTAAIVANASATGLIGNRFNGLYRELRLTWASDFAQMTVPENVFVDGVRTAIPVTAFTTSHETFRSWVTSAGGAIFCRASSATVRPGDTSWAVKPRSSTDTACGCNGDAWAGQGIFYGGLIPASVCTPWGGAFSGVRASGEPKGGLGSSADLALWVR
ncbi:MAG TPA: fibrinogen-like YCDxxxxGGGW domain-containing protein [Polyangiaceae bacterium]|nr:fibrinogen-like YCDxxxxGGGW domain-containing protein [Polyangiaceae bacterium]